MIAALHRIKALAGEMRAALLAEDLDGLGRLLDQGWQQKRQLSGGISSPQIDAWYAAARRAGALGGKIAGAGGGGFLLLYCPPGHQEHLRRELHMLQELPFNLGQDGSKVIFDYQR